MNEKPDNLEKKKLQVEIDKIEAEKDKVMQETLNLKKTATFSLISNFVSVIGGVIIGSVGILAVITGAERAIVQKDKAEMDKAKIIEETKKEKDKIIKDAQKEKERIIKEGKDEVEEYKKSYSKYREKTLNATSLADLKTKGLVFIQFRGSVQRSVMNELAQMYKQNGFQAPGVERLAGNYQTKVRYFNQEDSTLANQVAEIAKNFFIQKQCPIQQEIKVEKFSKNGKDVPKGQLELWVSLTHNNCK